LSAIFPSGKNQGGDLRITDSDKTTLLNFWVEQVIGTSPNRIAYVLVKIPSLSANQTKTLYVYFGNSSATNVSNGDNTFLFFDDFPGTSLDTNKWYAFTDGTISVANSEVALTGYNYTRAKIVSNTFQSTDNSKIIARGRVADAAQSGALLILQCDKNFGSSYNDPSNGFFVDLFTQFTLYKAVSNSLTTIATSSTDPFPDTNYHIYEQRKSGSAHQVVMDNSILISATDSTIFTNKYIGLASREVAYTTYFDWVFVAKYVSPEPAFSSAGSLEKRSSIIPLII